MTTNSHPQCRKPDDCRVYRQGERVCATCSPGGMKMNETQRRSFEKARRNLGLTRAKRMIIEEQLG